ncbi:hypothetical protein FJT64_020668 [Amphibalanus amphitrite]|uniref:DUF4789 domain-containing protein n=2 Tax=Amphibalanus amphitrite TaxID=1232801 RepID=A0A6A4WS28_AMPAM|nr:hypothetical protein FJT64_020668 [Amphibalanus amphitrite]
MVITMRVVLASLATLLLVAGTATARTERQFLKKCPRGFDLMYDRQARKLTCECKRNHLYWKETGLCYREFTQGPCKQGNRIVLNATSNEVICQCPTFWSQYEDGTCHEDFTRGPCPDGELIVYDPATDRGVCRCDASMRMHYFPKTGRCYPKYSQGPCNDGHIVKFDYRSLEPRCECRDGYTKWADGQCYQLNTAGPCDLSDCPGAPCLIQNLETLRTECTCLPSGARTADGHCYQPYSQGPCDAGQWLVLDNDGTSSCEAKKQCTRFDNWFFWEGTERCYRQYTQGPCELGQLFYMDPTTGQPSCRCDPTWNAYYWAEDGRCYEQHSVGPCPQGMFFGYNFTQERAECSCFKSHVLNPEDGTCLERHTRGPCDQGELVHENENGHLTCKCSKDLSSHYWEKDGKCYEHFKQGPCKDGETFRIDHRTGRPNCIVWQG